MVTLAPENATEEQVLALATAGVVVSLGHTDASFETACGYARAGARSVTHLFNAMSGLDHREPGVVGAALATDELHVGIIADGFHVDPAAMGIAIRGKQRPGRIFLVTDSMSTIGTDLTHFLLNGREIRRDGGRLTLAGADIDMLSSVRFAHERLGLPVEEAIRMAQRLSRRRHVSAVVPIISVKNIRTSDDQRPGHSSVTPLFVFSVFQTCGQVRSSDNRNFGKERRKAPSLKKLAGQRVRSRANPAP